MRIIYILLLLSSILFSHQTGLSYLKITKEKSGNMLVVYKKPLEDSQAKDISIKFPATCSRSIANSIIVKNGFIIEEFFLMCSHESLKGSRIWIEGLVSSDKGMLLYYEENGKVENSLLRASRPFMLIEDKRSFIQTWMQYIKLGFFHILSGYDHLLFLFALFLLVSNRKVLFYSITAFTVAHSITLGLSALHLISIPIPFIEALIALSVVILYREVLKTDKKSIDNRHLPWMVLLFGLLHGLGFASVLKQIGLPQHDVHTALLAFNIGIELGQILFITTIFIIAWILKVIFAKFFIERINIIKYLLAYIFGGLSSLWFIERILLF